jgi:NitT/TauT family transport system substrate-binding protein
MMKRRSSMLWLGCILVILTACQSLLPADERPPLRVEWTQWWGDYTTIIAKEKGFFDKQGVKVEPVSYDVFSQAVPDLAAGKIDIGLFGLSDALNVARRVPIKVVAVYDQGGDSTVVAAPGINTIADLKGKTVSVPAGGSTYEIFIQEMLKSAGLSLSDVTVVNVDPEALPERLGVDVQAGYTWEPYVTQLVKDGNHALYSSDENHLFPDVITLRADTAAERPEDVKAFLRAWFEALEYRRANPDESNAIISRVTGLPVEEITAGQKKILLQTGADNLATFAQNPGLDTSSIFYTAQTNLDYLISIGTASQPIDLNQVLDPSFLPKP